MSSNQAQFDETEFPFRNKEMIEKYQSDQSTDILFRTESDVKWIPYNPLHISNYTRVHFDPASDLMVMRVNTETNSFTRVTQLKWIQDKLALANTVIEEQTAYIAGISHRTLKGLPQSVDPDRQPKNYKDTMYKQDWAEAYDKEYRGFMERKAFKVVRPEKGIKIHDTLTRLEYKEDN